MKTWIICKPPMYLAMHDAAFSPGIIASVIIALFMWALYNLFREIPASLLDFINVLSKPDLNRYDYMIDPFTTLLSLVLTGVLGAVVILYVKRVECRPLTTLGVSPPRLLSRLGAGYLLGFLLLAAYALWEMLSGDFSFSRFQPVSLLFLIAFLIQAVSEEILYRGYLLSSLTAKTGVIPAALISSAVYAFLHIGDFGATVLSLAMLFLIGVLASLLTIRTNSLWAACGVNAAWHFFKGLVFPVYFGRLQTSYSALTIGLSESGGGSWGNPEGMPAVLLGLILIALVLLAGKNRLVARPTEEEQHYFRALRIAKDALCARKDDFGKPYIRRSAALSQKLDGAKRTAVLLADACNVGSLSADSLIGFDGEVMGLVDALVRRKETEAEYRARVKAHPDAYAVWTVKRDFEEKLLIRQTQWNNRKSSAVTAMPDEIHCPMLRVGILPEDCAEIAAQVDGYADEKADHPLRRMDRSLCKGCPNRENNQTRNF